MVKIDSSRCIGCGLCVEDCISKKITLQNGIAVAGEKCLLCGHCAAICPQGAVSITDFIEDPMLPYSPDTFSLPTGNLLNAIKFRRSIRNFKSNSIEHNKLVMLADAGRHTATAKNTQGCRFIFVQNELAEFKKVFWDSIENFLNTTDDRRMRLMLRPFFDGRNNPPKDEYLFRNAPAVLFVITNNAIDAGLAAQNIELMAISMGLGAMYNGYLCRTASALPEVRDWLQLGEENVGACMLLGYPAVTYTRTAPRRTDGIEFR